MRRSPVLLALACALVLPLAGCGDGPTAPTSYAQEVHGRIWVAVAEPDGLPDARTWEPYLAPGSPALAELRALSSAAGRARRDLRLEEAAELEARAAATAAASVGRITDPLPLVRSLDALQRWERNAVARLESGRHPELERAVTEVAGLREGARALLARGDTTAAIVQLARAAERVRKESPAAVALRLVAAAEARIDSAAAPTEPLRRARRLLRGAREGMATGDHTRALRRAVYALQLLEAEDARR